MRKIHKIIGSRFGRVVAIKKVEPYGLNQRYKYECICDCGKLIQVLRSSLTNGHTKSCGCLQREKVSEILATHKESIRNNKTPEYNAWLSMKQRCYYVNGKSYKYYGGRGISVCDRWLNSYENFLIDMGRRPSKKHSLDRIDVNGNYEPENCRWATVLEQANNKRRTMICI